MNKKANPFIGAAVFFGLLIAIALMIRSMLSG